MNWKGRPLEPLEEGQEREPGKMYIKLAHPFPNRETRRANGVRIPLQFILEYMNMMEENK